jgi:hypothetical protein
MGRMARDRSAHNYSKRYAFRGIPKLDAPYNRPPYFRGRGHRPNDHDHEYTSTGDICLVVIRKMAAAARTTTRTGLSPSAQFHRESRTYVSIRAVILPTVKESSSRRCSHAIGPTSSTNPRANDRGVRKYRETRRCRRSPPPSSPECSTSSTPCHQWLWSTISVRLVGSHPPWGHNLYVY